MVNSAHRQGFGSPVLRPSPPRMPASARKLQEQWQAESV